MGAIYLYAEVILMMKFWWLDPELKLTGSVTLSDGSKEPLLESGVESMTRKKSLSINRYNRYKRI